ncbi:MAG: FecCD family ABC transporter permease [Burkholderiales bacterium]
MDAIIDETISPGRLRRIPGRLPAGPALAALAAVSLAAFVFAVGKGAYAIAPAQVIAILAQQVGVSLPFEFDAQDQAVLLGIRLPRVLLAVLTGAGLALAGAALQGLFRNPLADPTLIGVSGGATAGVALVIALGATLAPGLSKTLGALTLPVAAFLGGLAATSTIYVLAKSGARTVLVTLLLAGIAINALAMAVIGLCTYLANDEQLRNLAFWNLGSLSPASWPTLSAIAAPLLAAFVFLSRLAAPLNALLIGEREANHLGVNVQAIKRRTVVLSALTVGFLVAVTGNIFFVALLAPHMVRLACGPDHRVVMPGSMLTGAILVMLADATARTVVAPAELPLGVVTSLIGAPFFLWLLLRKKTSL